MDLCNESCSTGPFCIAKILTLDITCQLFNPSFAVVASKDTSALISDCRQSSLPLSGSGGGGRVAGIEDRLEVIVNSEMGRFGTPAVCTPSPRLVRLVVKASALRAEDPGFKSCLRRDFFGVESYQ